MDDDCLTILDLSTDILFIVLDNVNNYDLREISYVNKHLYQLIKLYISYNKRLYRNIRLKHDPTYHNKKKNCIICRRYINKGSKTNSPYRRVILSCCNKRYIVLHSKCYHSLLMTIKCNDCNYVFKPNSLYNVSNINKISKYQYNVDIKTFIAIYNELI